MSTGNKTLLDLNDALFVQLERLGNETLKGEQLKEEVIRADAISKIGRDIVSNARLVLEADKHKAEYGNLRTYPKMLGNL